MLIQYKMHYNTIIIIKLTAPAAEMIHITCNMGGHDLPDLYALSPRACSPWALGIHIRHIPHVHVTTVTYT